MARRKCSALGAAPAARLDPDVRDLFARCEERIGFVPNVFRAYTLDQEKLRQFRSLYNDMMLGPSPLSELEREMIGVVVSAANRCYYCLVAHGAAVRTLSGDPELGEALAKNYRQARLSAKRRAMLDFAHKLAEAPDRIGDRDRGTLRRAGWPDLAVFHIALTVGLFSMTNRVASGIDMQPNEEYHSMGRTAAPANAGAKRRK